MISIPFYAILAFFSPSWHRLFVQIRFCKMHGAGNDFIVIDDRSLTFPETDKSFLQRICNRHYGIGAEGILLLQPSTRAQVRLRFFNPDGNEADMCGNGARCLARFAHHFGAAPAKMTLETAAGLVQAEVLPNDQVRLHLPPPTDQRPPLSLLCGGQELTIHYVCTGVPHAVVLVENLSAVDVAGLGSAIRHHPAFAPAGTNADFVAVTGTNTLSIRTFERGVEAETPACGTGVVAAAVVARTLGLVQEPVRLTTAGGDTLEVTLQPPTLTGPAEFVFEGTLPYR